ncbi:MAG: hypothetical protein ACN6PD_02895, partial [Sphingobacterium sp.]
NVKSYADVDVVTAVDNNVPFTAASGITVKNSGSGQAAAANNSLRAAALPSGVTYRLYLLSADGSQVLSSQQFTVGGTTVTVPVSAGQTYKWVALSYNNQDAIPTITTGSPSLVLPENKDVLYASGNVTIPSAPGSDVSLPITFNHVFSRLAIELNSMGVFGPMNSGTVSVSGLTLRTGTLNVATGALTPAATTFTPTINWSSFTNIDPAYSDAKIAYAYTAGTSTLNNIVVSVSNLAVTHVDNVNRTFGSTAPINISFNITPELGKSHRLLANIVESPLTSSLNSTKWARSNLYYDPSVNNGHNPYRFYGTNTQTVQTDGRGYFAFGSAIPRKFVSSSTPPQDPCALVYPQGLWKQPAHTNFSAYTTSDGLLTNILGNILQMLVSAPAPSATGLGTNYIQYPLAAANGGGGNAAFGAESNVLRFYHNGQINNVNVLTDFGSNGLVNLNLGTSYGRETAYWTNEQGINLLGLVGVGGWGYHAANKITLLGVNFKGAQGTAELLSNVDLLGLNVLSSTFKNVRCVRAN